MKKFMATIALLLAFTVAFATGCNKPDNNDSGDQKETKLHNSFIESLGGVSETFKGAISNNEYSSNVEAATAFVTEEIAGNSNVSIINTETKETYSEPTAIQNIITQQSLPIEDASTIESIEKMEVTYSLNGLPVSPVALMSEAEASEKVVVYVIKYPTHWEYFSPAPITGSTITRSYYDSVFNSEAWENCTYDMSMKMDMDIVAFHQGETQTMKMKMKATQSAQYDENKVFYETSYSVTMSGMGMDETESTYTAVYIEETEDGFVCYVKTGKEGSWQESYLSAVGFTSIDDLKPFADGYLDYTYFTKTDYGFELAGDNAKKFLEETMGDTLEDYLTQGMNIDMFAKFYVSNGILSGMREDANLKINMNQSGVNINMKADIAAEGIVKNYGTTVVQKPADINLI